MKRSSDFTGIDGELFLIQETDFPGETASIFPQADSGGKPDPFFLSGFFSETGKKFFASKLLFYVAIVLCKTVDKM